MEKCGKSTLDALIMLLIFFDKFRISQYEKQTLGISKNKLQASRKKRFVKGVTGVLDSSGKFTGGPDNTEVKILLHLIYITVN